MSAVLACGTDAVLSHRSAASLWGIVPSLRMPVEVTRPTKSRTRSGIKAYRAVIPADERTTIDGIPITSMSRTLLDLGAVLTRPQVERALNEADVLGLTNRLSVPDLLERYPRRRGSAVLRALFRDRTVLRGITRSKLERRFLAVLEGADLPRPRLNAAIAVRGRFFEVDCVWDERRLVVELDGREAHGTALAFEQDRERDRVLITEGWRVTRVTWRQLRDDAAAVVADLRKLLRQSRRPPTL